MPVTIVTPVIGHHLFFVVGIPTSEQFQWLEYGGNPSQLNFSTTTASPQGHKMMAKAQIKRKRGEPTLEEGLPIAYGKKFADLDDMEKERLEDLLWSKGRIVKHRERALAPSESNLFSEIDQISVADPFEAGAKIVAWRNIKNDPLARLHSHRQIDDAQFYAGRAYQRDWETAERGARAIDPTKEAVDGGRIPEPLSDSQGKARMRLVEIERALGRKMHRVAHAVLIEGMSMEVMALKLFGRHGETAAKYYGRLFRDALDELAVEYRLASR